MSSQRLASGFKGVGRNTDRGKPFKAELCHDGRHKYLGLFSTAEEAALAYARALGPEGVAAALAPPAPEPVPMTAAEAHAGAAAEGLKLLPADNATGFSGVYLNNSSPGKPFKANPYHDGRHHHQGYFATGEEAALAVARFLGPQGAAPAPEPTMTAAEAHAAAAAEGLSLVCAENATGFKYVGRLNGVSKPFRAAARGQNLGVFATAEEAALVVARFLAPTAQPAPAATQPTPTVAAAVVDTPDLRQNDRKRKLPEVSD